MSASSAAPPPAAAWTPPEDHLLLCLFDTNVSRAPAERLTDDEIARAMGQAYAPRATDDVVARFKFLRLGAAPAVADPGAVPVAAPACLSPAPQLPSPTQTPPQLPPSPLHPCLEPPSSPKSTPLLTSERPAPAAPPKMQPPPTVAAATAAAAAAASASAYASASASASATASATTNPVAQQMPPVCPPPSQQAAVALPRAAMPVLPRAPPYSGALRLPPRPPPPRRHVVTCKACVAAANCKACKLVIACKACKAGRCGASRPAGKPPPVPQPSPSTMVAALPAGLPSVPQRPMGFRQLSSHAPATVAAALAKAQAAVEKRGLGGFKLTHHPAYGASPRRAVPATPLGNDAPLLASPSVSEAPLDSDDVIPVSAPAVSGRGRKTGRGRGRGRGRATAGLGRVEPAVGVVPVGSGHAPAPLTPGGGRGRSAKSVRDAEDEWKPSHAVPITPLIVAPGLASQRSRRSTPSKYRKEPRNASDEAGQSSRSSGSGSSDADTCSPSELALDVDARPIVDERGKDHDVDMQEADQSGRFPSGSLPSLPEEPAEVPVAAGADLEDGIMTSDADAQSAGTKDPGTLSSGSTADVPVSPAISMPSKPASSDSGAILRGPDGSLLVSRASRSSTAPARIVPRVVPSKRKRHADVSADETTQHVGTESPQVEDEPSPASTAVAVEPVAAMTARPRRKWRASARAVSIEPDDDASEYAEPRRKRRASGRPSMFAVTLAGADPKTVATAFLSETEKETDTTVAVRSSASPSPSLPAVPSTDEAGLIASQNVRWTKAEKQMLLASVKDGEETDWELVARKVTAVSRILRTGDAVKARYRRVRVATAPQEVEEPHPDPSLGRTWTTSEDNVLKLVARRWNEANGRCPIDWTHVCRDVNRYAPSNSTRSIRSCCRRLIRLGDCGPDASAALFASFGPQPVPRLNIGGTAKFSNRLLESSDFDLDGVVPAGALGEIPDFLGELLEMFGKEVEGPSVGNDCPMPGAKGRGRGRRARESTEISGGGSDDLDTDVDAAMIGVVKDKSSVAGNGAGSVFQLPKFGLFTNWPAARPWWAHRSS